MATIRIGLALFVVALAAMAMVVRSIDQDIDFLSGSEPDGHGLVADALDLDEVLMMESDSARRQLQGGGGHVSYAALRRNKVPCSKRGQSYYNCGRQKSVNPYKRGCTRATYCARNNG